MSWLRSLADRWRRMWARLSHRRARAQLLACLQSETLDGFPELLLRLMSIRVRVDRDFARNLEGCEVSYMLRARGGDGNGDGAVAASAIFHDGRMKVRAGAIDHPDVELVFADNRALEKFLLARRQAERDLAGAIATEAIVCVGNVNYLNKLAYMSRRLIALELRAGQLRDPSSRSIAANKIDSSMIGLET